MAKEQITWFTAASSRSLSKCSITFETTVPIFGTKCSSAALIQPMTLLTTLNSTLSATIQLATATLVTVTFSSLDQDDSGYYNHILLYCSAAATQFPQSK